MPNILHPDQTDEDFMVDLIQCAQATLKFLISMGLTNGQIMQRLCHEVAALRPTLDPSSLHRVISQQLALCAVLAESITASGLPPRMVFGGIMALNPSWEETQELVRMKTMARQNIM